MKSSGSMPFTSGERDADEPPAQSLSSSSTVAAISLWNTNLA